MKTPLAFLFLLILSVGYSQERLVPLVETERSFARYAIEHNTRDAFLKFMDSNAVVFNKGTIENALRVWEAKKPAPFKLIWEPAFAVISAAGDIGITTGPWQFKPSANDTVVATGEFTTVWIKKDTTWKWIVDMGIDHNQKVASFKDVNGIELSHIERSSYDAVKYLLINEDNFIKNYTANGKDAYHAVADKDIYFVTNGYTPVRGQGAIDAALVNLSGSMQFQVAGSGVSKDGDIGYVYGYANEKDKKGNYLRVWRRIGRRWTLLLQTLVI